MWCEGPCYERVVHVNARQTCRTYQEVMRADDEVEETHFETATVDAERLFRVPFDGLFVSHLSTPDGSIPSVAKTPSPTTRLKALGIDTLYCSDHSSIAGSINVVYTDCLKKGVQISPALVVGRL